MQYSQDSVPGNISSHILTVTQARPCWRPALVRRSSPSRAFHVTCSPENRSPVASVAVAPCAQPPFQKIGPSPPSTILRRGPRGSRSVEGRLSTGTRRGREASRAWGNWHSEVSCWPAAHGAPKPISAQSSPGHISSAGCRGPAGTHPGSTHASES